MDRRLRRLAQVKAWADCRRQYRLKLGDLVIGFDALTDEAFADLRDRIASDIWRERRRNRANRAIAARMHAMADRIADRSFAA